MSLISRLRLREIRLICKNVALDDLCSLDCSEGDHAFELDFPELAAPRALASLFRKVAKCPGQTGVLRGCQQLPDIAT